MTKRKRLTPEEVLERHLLKMKAMGITISYTPDPFSPRSDDRPMAILHAKAKELGMTYGDEPTEPKEASRG